MKYMIQILALGGLLVLLNSCKTSSTQFTILKAAEIKLPSHINTLAAVDRSKPENGWANALEGLLTGENIFQDQDGRRAAISGFSDVLTRTPRFKVIRTGIEMTGSNGGSVFPEALNWETIENICREYNADAVVAIELFDSDGYTNTNRNERKSKNKNGDEIIEVFYSANRNLSLSLGWRVYDPKTKSIIDEYISRDDISDSAEGRTKDAARANLASPNRIVSDLGYNVGRLYGGRVAPLYTEISRKYYTKAKKNDKVEMEKATNLVKRGEWNRAAQIWRSLIAESNDPKTRGRAAHNMAVAAEREGQLESALDWAEKAYFDFGNKGSKSYVDYLNFRINDQRRLNEQMEQEINP
ncbi:MAG: DUF6340 family protein [Saprospiraceae bacterium]